MSQEKINFEEICFINRISFHDVISYQKYLQWRIKQVECVIKEYFLLIKPNLFAKV